MSRSRLLELNRGQWVGGWRIDREDFEELHDTSTDVSRLLRSRFDYPKESDPRDHLNWDLQGRKGSCVGHGGTTVCEHCYWIATEGDELQFSRDFAYYGSQKIDGITGDKGATINGFTRLATEYGMLPEDQWPYREKYDPTPPRPWRDLHDEAREYGIQSHTVLGSAKESLRYLQVGAGGVLIGIPWGSRCSVDRDGWFQYDPGGDNAGGHALAICGYGVYQSKDFLWCLNSWPNWGLDGWMRISMQTMERIHKDDRSAVVGLSDMRRPNTVRRIDWSKNSPHVPGPR